MLYYALLLQRIAYYFDSVENPPLSDQYTDETAAATRSAQQLLGLEQTGIADADTWTASRSAEPGSWPPTPRTPIETPHPAPLTRGAPSPRAAPGQEVGRVERWLNRRAQLFLR